MVIPWLGLSVFGSSYVSHLTFHISHLAAHPFGIPALQEMLRLSRRPPFWDDLSIVASKALA